MTPGGFRTRKVITELRACWGVVRSAVYPLRHPDVIGYWLRDAWAAQHRWNAERDWARLCPHPPEFRGSSQFRPGWIDCERCHRPLHFPVEQGAGSLLTFRGWRDGHVPEQPNACTCHRMSHHGPDDHWANCPTRWMNDDGSMRAEPLPHTLPKYGVSITYRTDEEREVHEEIDPLG